MTAPEPVPFRLPLPGRDSIDLDGVRSVSYRVDGLLHLAGRTLTLEWTGTEHVEQVSLGRVRVDDDPLPHEALDVPVGLIAEARLLGGWWWPRLELRARRLDAFTGVPGARPGTVTLRLRRRDRALAAALLVALADARADAALADAEADPMLDWGGQTRLGAGD